MNRSTLSSPELTHVGTVPFGIHENVPVTLPMVPTDGASESHILIRSTDAPKEHDVALFGHLLPNLIIVGRQDDAPFRVAMVTKPDLHNPSHTVNEPIFDPDYPPQNVTFIRPEHKGDNWFVGHMPDYRHDRPAAQDIERLAVLPESQRHFDDLIGIIVRACRRSQANFIQANSRRLLR